MVLNDINLEIPEGQIVGLIGPSGAGKSTLIRCINRLIKPSSGSISLDGTNLSEASPKKIRQQRRYIGMIFQEYALVERLSVMENVLSGRLGYLSFGNPLPAVTRKKILIMHSIIYNALV
ncbi:ATP-binding cassette domain-containing protein [Psychromonas sp. KJ10-2]|uniref:ATP-binding cassette domain-containing protein n=1 Tax=Psychromonas sp. KJ10-2 TaxID=3391822 RepID=UPI0039B57364